MTTNLTINFLRKPAPATSSPKPTAQARQALAVGEVNICSDGEDEPVAHVTSTYSIPLTANELCEGIYNTIHISH